MSVESVLLIIVCLILAGVLSVVGFMFLKLRRLQVDPAAYDELQGRCEYGVTCCVTSFVVSAFCCRRCKIDAPLFYFFCAAFFFFFYSHV